MRVDKKRRGRGIHEVLGVVAAAFAWGATEIHVLPDKFQLELRATPAKDTVRSLEDLLGLREITAVRLTKEAVEDLQGVFAFCADRGYFLVRIYVRNVPSLFQWAGLRPAATLMGVPVAPSDQLERGSIVFALSKVPYGPLSTVNFLLKGEYYEG